ncbi:MAG: ComEA family DNA-binding protein [Fimbriimonadaceae bacterium]|nr:ComEA family DNA-binding protein [Fimbriimonadaceae bacterium]
MFSHLSTVEKLKMGSIAVVVAVAMGYLGTRQWKQPAPIVFRNEPLPEGKPAPESEASTIVIQVAGAVRRPGVYRLPSSARVHDAIRTAGGAKENADLSEWNLAAKIVDGKQIFVNSKPDRAPVATSREPGPSRPKALGGSLPLHVEVPSELRGGIGALGVQPEGSTRRQTGKKEAPGVASISLNTGSQADLERLPGVGPSTAQKILSYRQEHGGFTSIDELLAVKGIGPKKLESMRKFLRL